MPVTIDTTTRQSGQVGTTPDNTIYGIYSDQDEALWCYRHSNGYLYALTGSNNYAAPLSSPQHPAAWKGTLSPIVADSWSISWARQDDANSPRTPKRDPLTGNTIVTSISTCRQGDYLYMAYNYLGQQQIAGVAIDLTVAIKRFSMSTDTWSVFAAEGASGEPVASKASFAVEIPAWLYWGNVLAARSDGSLAMLYPGQVSYLGFAGYEVYVNWISCSSSGVWGAPVQIDTRNQPLGFDLDLTVPIGMCVDSSDRCYCFYQRETCGPPNQLSGPKTIQYRCAVVDATGAIVSDTVFPAKGFHYNTLPTPVELVKKDHFSSPYNAFYQPGGAIGKPVVWNDGTSEKVYVPCCGEERDQRPIVYSSPVGATPSWTQEIASSENMGIGGRSFYFQQRTIALLVSAGKLYCFWNQDIYQNNTIPILAPGIRGSFKTTHAGAWSAAVQYFTDSSGATEKDKTFIQPFALNYNRVPFGFGWASDQINDANTDRKALQGSPLVATASERIRAFIGLQSVATAN